MAGKAPKDPKWQEAWEMVEASARPYEPPPEPELTPIPEPEPENLTVEQRLERMSPTAKRELIARLKEKQRRQIEPQSLYEPMPHQEPFHKSRARLRLLGGGNRGGKTLCGMMEIGWIIRGNHPYYNYPKGGVIYMVGRDQDHIADVLGKTLLEPGGGNGEWRRIRDLVTGQWRSYRPWQDSHRADEAELMPPIIPPYLILGKPSYDSKSRGVLSQLKTTTGWTINFYTGGSDPPQGSSPDYVHLDEEITNRRWLTEMMARVTSKSGRVTWAATAEIGGESLWLFHMKCVEELDRPPAERMFEEFTAVATSNAHLSEKQVAEMDEMLRLDPIQYETKFLGKYAVEAFRVYPHFHPKTHVVPAFSVPEDWCRYMIVDPGNVVTAVLFFAVPPPGQKPFSGHWYVYGELYLQDTNAVNFGRSAKEFIGSQAFEDFIIDWCGSRRMEMGGESIREQLEAALVANRIKCLRRGSRFLNSSSDVDAGILQTKTWLLPTEDGLPKLLIMEGMAPKLVLEMQRYHHKRDNATGLSTGKPNQLGVHCVDTLRYGVMHGMPYVKPRNPARKKSEAQTYLDEKRKRQGKNKDKSIWMTSGPTA